MTRYKVQIPIPFFILLPFLYLHFDLEFAKTKQRRKHRGTALMDSRDMEEEEEEEEEEEDDDDRVHRLCMTFGLPYPFYQHSFLATAKTG
jgi:hypothetical protein